MCFVQDDVFTFLQVFQVCTDLQALLSSLQSCAVFACGLLPLFAKKGPFLVSDRFLVPTPRGV